jgi:hypothetical protein
MGTASQMQAADVSPVCTTSQSSNDHISSAYSVQLEVIQQVFAGISLPLRY